MQHKLLKTMAGQFSKQYEIDGKAGSKRYHQEMRIHMVSLAD